MQAAWANLLQFPWGESVIFPFEKTLTGVSGHPAEAKRAQLKIFYG